MSNYLQVGPCRIAIVNGSGVRTSTYYLPPPDKDTGISLVWDKKAYNETLYDGSEVERLLGFVPELTLSWSIYDDKNAIWGNQIGSSNGNQLDFLSFMSILDTPSGYISVSPGMTAGGFVCSSWKVDQIGTLVGGLATGITVTFRGTGIYSTRTLGSF